MDNSADKLANVIIIFFIAIFVFRVNSALADEFTSSSFISSQPVIYSGGYGTSTSYALIGTIAQIAQATSTSAGFGVNSGFLYFPAVSSPIVTATAGNTTIDLSWTNSVGLLGWTVSGYNVGQSLVPGGPYTYSSLGNITSSTRTGLTNGATYYFVIRPEDAFGNSIATSSEVSSVPVGPAPSPAPAPSPSPGGGGGGGGASPSPSPTPSPAPAGASGSSGATKKITLKGLSSPFAAISIFKDGTVVATPTADKDGNWQEDITTLNGSYNFSIYGVDSSNKRTLTTAFTINVDGTKTGENTISGIIVPPTITSNLSVVKTGNFITFTGATYPDSIVNITINSATTIADRTKSDSKGIWTYKLQSSLLEKGDHSIKTQVMTKDGLTSSFSENLGFKVGDANVSIGNISTILPVGPTCDKHGDINKDGKVNIIDFSILLFFWGQKNPSNPCANVNQTGVVDIVDFSIMLFWWTG